MNTATTHPRLSPSLTGLALAAAATLAACGSAGGAAGSQSAELPSSAAAAPASDHTDVTLRFARTREAPLAWTSDFLVASDGAVEIATEVSKLMPGSHTLVQEVRSPAGTVFETCSFTFSRDGLSGADCTGAAGEPLAKGPPAVRLWNRLSPAKIWGRWSVAAYFDGAAQPAATAAFSLGGRWAEVRLARSRQDPQWTSAFSFGDTPQIEIATDLYGFDAGSHSLRTDLFQPAGASQTLYGTLRVSFDPASCEKVGEACRVWQTVQVRGTVIDAYHMAGGWTVVETADSSASPVGSADFTLN